jgi:hypothetical protein
MQSPFSFIVRPVKGRRYDNIKEIGGIDFITSSSKEDHTVSNRFGEVISLPINYTGDVKIGDILLVHHNVFKFYYDMYGKEKSGKSYFREDMFLVDEDQFFYIFNTVNGQLILNIVLLNLLKLKNLFLEKLGKKNR